MEAIENILTRHKTGRNDDCPCGSGKKYKKCHLQTDDGAVSAHLKGQAEARAKEAPQEDHSGHEHGPNGEHLYDKPTRPAQHSGPGGAPRIPIVSKPVTTPRKAS